MSTRSKEEIKEVLEIVKGSEEVLLQQLVNAHSETEIMMKILTTSKEYLSDELIKKRADILFHQSMIETLIKLIKDD